MCTWVYPPSRGELNDACGPARESCLQTCLCTRGTLTNCSGQACVCCGKLVCLLKAAVWQRSATAPQSLAGTSCRHRRRARRRRGARRRCWTRTSGQSSWRRLSSAITSPTKPSWRTSWSGCRCEAHAATSALPAALQVMAQEARAQGLRTCSSWMCASCRFVSQ